MQGNQENRPVTLLLVSTFLLWFSVYTYPSFLSVYAETKLLASPVLIGAIVGSYGFTQMLLRIPLGVYSDLIRKRKPFLLLGMAASALAALGLALFPTPAGALIFRGLSGVAASTWVTFSVMYSAHFKPNELSAAMGRISFVQYGSQIVAMLLGAYLAQMLGEAAAFYLAAGGGLLGLLVVSRIRDMPPAGEAQSVASLLSVAKNKRLLLSTALSTIFHFACWGTVLGFTANWGEHVIGLDTAQLGMLAAMYLLPNAIMSRLSGGLLVPRLGERGVMLLGFMISAAACALFCLTRSIWALFAVQGLFGLGMGMILPLTISNAISDIPNEKRGAAMGFYQSIYGVGMFVGPVLAGAIISAFSAEGNVAPGYIANFLVMAGICLLGLALAALRMPGEGRS